MPQLIADFLKARSLVSVHRESVDRHEIQGFLIGASESLLALEYVYDFQVDGLMVLRRADVTEIAQAETDAFQEQLLKSKGIVGGVLGIKPLRLEGWKSVIDQIASDAALMILEQEAGTDPEFSIGRPIRMSKTQVEFQSFSGTGVWYDQPDKLKLSRITCLQAYSRYLNFYQQHFERSPG